VTTGEQAPETVDRLLRSLPGWFGIESSIIEYVEAARETPTYLARAPGESPPVGVLLASRHFPAAGVQLLQVKTLGPSRPDPGYGRTRLFYEGVGFAPLEEITGLCPDNPCLIMVKVLG